MFDCLEFNGECCRLLPLSYQHMDDLVTAVKDGALWQLWYTLIPRPEFMREEIGRRLTLGAEGKTLPMTIIALKTGKPVGMTSYLNIDHDNRRLEIGGTWLAQSYQRTAINSECKYLLLQHAFEEWGYHAVEFRTHRFNASSRKAIERLGARLDGVLRNHMVMPNGSLRDTCVYSIIDNEWPTVKTHLEHAMIKPSALR